MSNVVLVIHLLLAIALIGVVLLQRSEGGGLGIGGGGGGGGMAGFLTGSGTKSLLTRTTAILAACFMVTSLLLTWIEGRTGPRQSILDAPVEAPVEPVPTVPEGPTVPIE